MLDYARSDTHFLLYCYDRVRNELVKRSDSSDFQNNLIGQVLLGSKETSLRRHEREIYDAAHGSGPNGWGLTLSRTPIAYNTEQMAVFKAVHEWRDKVARSEDESHHYVLPKHQLFNLARLMPEDVLGILGACHPASSCVRLRVSEILSVIQEARGEALPSQPKLNVAPVGTNNMQEAPEPPPSTALTNTKGVDISSIDIFSYEDISNQGHLRADVSNFWGSAVGSSKWSKTMGKAAGPLSDIRLPLPLPQLTAAIFLNPNDAKKLCDPGSMAEHEYTRNRPQQKDDSIIVVKQVGGKLTKRKREEAQPLADGLVAHYEIIDEVNSEDIQTPIDDIEETIVFSTTQSPDKEENKQRRKKKKGKEMESKDMQAGEEENVPFDYSKAASVLNGAAKDGNTSRGFNPYSKPGEGPKSGRRGRREKEGKTFTFQR